MNDTLFTLYLLKPIEKVELDFVLNSNFLSDKVFSTKIKQKDSLTFLGIDRKKVIIIQNKSQILLISIILIENLTMIIFTYITNIRFIVSKTLNYIDIFLSAQNK